MTIRSVARWTLYHACERGSFFNIDILQFFAEKDSRRLSYAANADPVALAKINLVAVEGENILFREPSFQRDCKHRFIKFSLERFLGS